VIGDGMHTVRELVDEVNQDPRRGDGHATALTKIRLDEIAVARLALQGLTPDAVPEKGQRVILRNNANLSTGGTATDVTDDVHPEVAARAVAAAQMVGLHICGVDVVAETVHAARWKSRAAASSRSTPPPACACTWRPATARVAMWVRPWWTAVRPRRQRPHPRGGRHRHQRQDHHRPPDRAPVLAQGLRVGMTNTDGVYVNGRQIDSGDCSGPKSARNVLMHPDVDAAVLETARGGILREGLGFDRCQVAVVTNIGAGDHLGLNYITTVEDLAVLKRVIVQNVAPTGYAVLNAMIPSWPPWRRVPWQGHLLCQRPHTPCWSRTGPRASAPCMWMATPSSAAEGSWREQHAAARHAHHPQRQDRLPGRERDGRRGRGLGQWLPWETIRRRPLASFVNDSDNAPGRFNLMDYRAPP
jgi:cyanophycin synthetase